MGEGSMQGAVSEVPDAVQQSSDGAAGPPLPTSLEQGMEAALQIGFVSLLASSRAQALCVNWQECSVKLTQWALLHIVCQLCRQLPAHPWCLIYHQYNILCSIQDSREYSSIIHLRSFISLISTDDKKAVCVVRSIFFCVQEHFKAIDKTFLSCQLLG